MANDKSKMQNIVRVLNTDLDGDKKIYHALLRVKGISHNFSRAILRAASIDENKRLKDLSDEEISKIEDVAHNPLKYNIPQWMLNRRKDYETGEDKHILGTDIELTVKADVNRLRKIRAYRGIRHELGLPVRGQRTRTSFRHGRTVGVIRNKK